MTKEELVRRVQARSRWERSITLPVILPVLVIWLGGSWLIWQDMILTDRSTEFKDQVLLALLVLAAAVQAMLFPLILRKSAFRAHGLLCPQCDGRALNVWKPRKLIETGKCPHCGRALVDNTSS